MRRLRWQRRDRGPAGAVVAAGAELRAAPALPPACAQKDYPACR